MLRTGPLNIPAFTTSLINERVPSLLPAQPSYQWRDHPRKKEPLCGTLGGVPAPAARAPCLPTICQVSTKPGKRGQCHPGKLQLSSPRAEPLPSLSSLLILGSEGAVPGGPSALLWPLALLGWRLINSSCPWFYVPPLPHLVGPAPPRGPLPATDIPAGPGWCARATRAGPRPNPPAAWPDWESPAHLPALWGLPGSAVAETHNRDKGAAPRGLTQPSRPGCAAFGEFNELSITPFRARSSAWINLRSPGGVGDTKPVFITLPLSLIEVIICDSGLANNAAFTPGTSMGLAPTLSINPPSSPLPNPPRANWSPGA